MSGYAANQKWGRWAIRFQVLGLVFLLLCMLAVYLDYKNLAFFMRGQQYTYHLFFRLPLQRVLKVLWVVLILPGGGIYLWWLYRAYSNLHWITAGWRYRSEMAVIGWLIPVANLFIPYFIINDLFRLTANRLHIGCANICYRSWWFFCVLTQLLGMVVFWHLGRLHNLEQMLAADRYLFYYYLMVFIMVVLNIKVMQDYIKMENILYEQVVYKGRVFILPV